MHVTRKKKRASPKRRAAPERVFYAAAMATASMLTLRFAPAAARPRRERATAQRTCASAEKKGQAWNDKATVAGGGYGGSCEIDVRVPRGSCCASAAARQPGPDLMTSAFAAR